MEVKVLFLLLWIICFVFDFSSKRSTEDHRILEFVKNLLLDWFLLSLVKDIWTYY